METKGLSWSHIIGLLPLYMHGGQAEGLSLQGCSRGSHDFIRFIAVHMRWLPEIFWTNVQTISAASCCTRSVFRRQLHLHASMCHQIHDKHSVPELFKASTYLYKKQGWQTRHISPSMNPTWLSAVLSFHSPYRKNLRQAMTLPFTCSHSLLTYLLTYWRSMLNKNDTMVQF